MNILIFGGSSTALEISETISLCHKNFKIWFVVGDDEQISADSRVGDRNLKELTHTLKGEIKFIISQSNHNLRALCLNRANALGLKPMCVIHPNAFISPSASFGKGTYIAAGACISANSRIGDYSIINYGVVFGHDSRCDEHFIASPGCVIGGNVDIGARVMLGANSFILQGLKVGDDTQIDAVTYVYKNIGERKICTNRNLTVINRINFS